MYKFDLLTSPFSPVHPSPSIHPELSFHCEKWGKMSKFKHGVSAEKPG